MESFLQTQQWAKFKETQGWQASQWGDLWGLSRPILGSKRLLYFPEIHFDNAQELIRQFTSVAGEGGDRETNSVFVVRFELLSLWTKEWAAELMEAGLKKSFESVQPEYRQWIDLTLSEERLLEQMKPKGRYNLALTKRHNLRVERGQEPRLVNDLYRLYRETARRAKFHGRNEAYFAALLEAMGDRAEIVAVYQKEEPLAAGLFIYYGGIASYLYGGSGGDRSLMAPYLMHWEAMRRGKEKSCQIYDLLAVAPPDQPKHPYIGLSRFKQQFGGETVRLLGSWDLIFQPMWYVLYRLAAKWRSGRGRQ